MESSNTPRKSAGYRAGRWIAGHRLISAAIAGGVIFVLYPSSPNTPPALVATVPTVDHHIEACGPKLDKRLQSANDAAAKKDFQTAFNLLDYCAGLIPQDGAAYKARAKFELERNKQVEAKAVADEKAVVAEAKAAKAAKKKSGVTIGMTMQDVLDSSWGRPNSVNRTTSANGKTEQWVYNGNYLYFTDGILTVIQN